jgi:hypothetical protein
MLVSPVPPGEKEQYIVMGFSGYSAMAIPEETTKTPRTGIPNLSNLGITLISFTSCYGLRVSVMVCRKH